MVEDLISGLKDALAYQRGKRTLKERRGEALIAAVVVELGVVL
jgi:hypothetical protein